MNFKRYNESDNSWTDSHYIMGTDTDTLSQLPAVIYPNDTGITVGLKGQSSQSGTPSPSQPCDVLGCGERTSNLVYSSQTQTVGTDLQISQTIGSTEYILNKSETANAISTATLCDMTLQAGTYTITVNGINEIVSDNTFDRVFIRDSDNNIVVQDIYNNTPKTFTLNTTTTLSKIVFVAHQTSTYNNNKVTIMLNAGSTALPYEPYGYKIPILLNSTTINKYLGEEQTVRQIRKLVLTGQEAGWNRSSSVGRNIFYLDTITPDYLRSDDITLLCSHYKAIAGVTGSGDVGEGETALYKTVGVNQRLYFGDNNYSAVDDFKAYLAAQYSAGTPLTVWYVLATPQTATVNEPLMKIGTYADSLSTTIPVTAGENTLDVQTTVAPSEVTATFEGWHAVSAAHERENGQWD